MHPYSRASIASALNSRTLSLHGALGRSKSSRENLLMHAHAALLRWLISCVSSPSSLTRPPKYRNWVVWAYFCPVASMTSGGGGDPLSSAVSPAPASRESLSSSPTLSGQIPQTLPVYRGSVWGIWPDSVGEEDRDSLDEGAGETAEERGIAATTTCHRSSGAKVRPDFPVPILGRRCQRRWRTHAGDQPPEQSSVGMHQEVLPRALRPAESTVETWSCQYTNTRIQQLSLHIIASVVSF